MLPPELALISSLWNATQLTLIVLTWCSALHSSSTWAPSYGILMTCACPFGIVAIGCAGEALVPPQRPVSRLYSITEPEHPLFDQLLESFDDVFQPPSGLPSQRSCDHQIHLLPNTVP